MHFTSIFVDQEQFDSYSEEQKENIALVSDYANIDMKSNFYIGKLFLTGKEIKYIFSFTGKDDLRPRMQHILGRIQNNRLHLYATNAHYMYSTHIESVDMPDGDFVISPEQISNVKSNTNTYCITITKNLEEQHYLTIDDTYCEITPFPCEEQNWSFFINSCETILNQGIDSVNDKNEPLVIEFNSEKELWNTLNSIDKVDKKRQKLYLDLSLINTNNTTNYVVDGTMKGYVLGEEENIFVINHFDVKVKNVTKVKYNYTALNIKFLKNIVSRKENFAFRLKKSALREDRPFIFQNRINETILLMPILLMENAEEEITGVIEKFIEKK
jgi:hypothetical protein